MFRLQKVQGTSKLLDRKVDYDNVARSVTGTCVFGRRQLLFLGVKTIIVMKSNKIHFIRNFFSLCFLLYLCLLFHFAFMFLFFFLICILSFQKKIILGQKLSFRSFCRSVKNDKKIYSQHIIFYLFQKNYHNKYGYRFLIFLKIFWSHRRRYKR